MKKLKKVAVSDVSIYIANLTGSFHALKDITNQLLYRIVPLLVCLFVEPDDKDQPKIIYSLF